MNLNKNILIINIIFLLFCSGKLYSSNNLMMNNKIINVKNNNNFVLIKDLNKSKNDLIIKTDVLLLKINLKGGDIERALLLKYKDKLGTDKPIKLLKTYPNYFYQAQSGIIGNDGPDNFETGNRPLYFVKHKKFFLKDGKNQLIVPLTYISPNGVKYTKYFLLKRGEYTVNISYNIKNKSNKPIKLMLLGQLTQTRKLPIIKNNDISNNREIAYSSSNYKYKRYNFSKFFRNDFYFTTKSGWVAMLEKYFFTAFIPLTSGENKFYFNVINNNKVTIGFKSNPILIKPGKETNLKSIIWIGPKIQNEMAKISPNLKFTVNYGWLWIISNPLFNLLKFIHNYVKNWGVSIIIITLIVRCAMYPLTKYQYIYMQKMRSLQPQLIEISKSFSQNKQRFSQEIISLYKKENINPLVGLIPFLIQMPIFISLYNVLSKSIELRHEPFIFWIKDLSKQDPYYILPIIMGLTMLYIHKLSNNTKNNKINYFIFVMLTVLFLWFPSGLVLYYIISNIITIIQQQFFF